MGKSIAARRPVLDANQKVIAFKIILETLLKKKISLVQKNYIISIFKQLIFHIKLWIF